MNPRSAFSKFLRALPAFVALIPPCLVLMLILHYAVDVPYWDDWAFAPIFTKFFDGTLTLRDLFAQQNEYRQFFPNLIFLGLGLLTKWNQTYELLVSFALACLVSFNVYRLEKLTIGGSTTRRRVIYLLSNLIIFSPIQHNNWLLGVQVVYFMPIACLTTCLVVAYSQLGVRVKFLVCMGLATVATFSSANGMLSWVLVLPLLAWPDSEVKRSKKTWLILAWIVGFIGNVFLYFHGYEKPHNHPSLTESLIHPVDGIKYFLVVLGRPLEPGDLFFSQFRLGHLSLAFITGLSVGILFLVCAVWILRNKRVIHASAGWLMLGIYSIATAILVTVGRAGFGIDQAFSLRYTTFTSYLPLALLHLIPLIFDNQKRAGRFTFRKERIVQIVAGAMLALQLLLYPFHIRQMAAFSKWLGQGKACLLLINVVRDECLAEKVFRRVEKLTIPANRLDALGFLRPALIKGNRAEDLAVTGTPDGNRYGSVDSVTRNGESFIASGWAVWPERNDGADAILLTYKNEKGDSIIFARTDTGAARSVMTRFLLSRSPYEYASWEKSFTVKGLPANLVINAWAFDARTGKAVQLAGTHVIR